MVLLHKLLLKEYLSYVLYRKTDAIVHSIALLIQRIAKDASVLYIVADGNNFPGKHDTTLHGRLSLTWIPILQLFKVFWRDRLLSRLAVQQNRFGNSKPKKRRRSAREGDGGRFVKD